MSILQYILNLSLSRKTFYFSISSCLWLLLFLPLSGAWINAKYVFYLSRHTLSSCGSRLLAHTDESKSIDDDITTRTDGEIVELNDVDRIYCLSDLHTDHPDNQKWLKKAMAESDFTKRDLIIVAGDISHDMETFQKSLSSLAAKAHILFVPGNHEAWIDRRHQPHSTSFEKLDEVYRACQQLGVHTKSLLVRNNSTYCPHPLWVVPLESWYDGTLSFREDLCKDFEHWPWVDFHRCVWENPDFLPGPPGTSQGRLPVGLVEFFLDRNEAILQNNPFSGMFSTNGPDPESTGIMTVSHFLPNLQTLPDWKEIDSPEFKDEWFDHGAGGMSAKFAKVAGSALLDKQIRSLLPSSLEENNDNNINGADGGLSRKKRLISVFGHSHRPKDFEFRGIRYIHNPLGKPRERAMHMVDPNVNFQLVWKTDNGEEIASKRVVRYWEEQGGGLEALERRLREVKPRGRYNKYKGSAYNKTQHNASTTAATESSRS